MADNLTHSTGRGGAGNIGKDGLVYADGDVVREGVVGEPGHPEGGHYSAGRGGAGNVVPSPRGGTPANAAAAHPPAGLAPGAAPAGGATSGSADVIPETAMREQTPGHENFHTGRGGGGNVHKDKYGGHSSKREQEEALAREGKHEGGILGKAKHALGMDKKKGGSS